MSTCVRCVLTVYLKDVLQRLPTHKPHLSAGSLCTPDNQSGTLLTIVNMC